MCKAWTSCAYIAASELDRGGFFVVCWCHRCRQHGIITLRAIYGIIERRTEANILQTSLEFGRFSKIAAKMKLCTRGRPWFFVIL